MFVSKRRIILKTCGNTTPLLCLKSMLQLVKDYAAFDEVQDLFYSRKNYKRPELQQEPHRTFSAEAALLDAMFHGKCFFQLAISSVLVTSIFLVSK